MSQLVIMIARALNDIYSRLPKRSSRSDLAPESRVLLRRSWERLATEAARLKGEWTHHTHQNVLPLMSGLCSELYCAVCVAETICRRFLIVYPPVPLSTIAPKQLKVGMGSPGYTGCVNVEGNSVSWGKFTNASHGVLAAMRALDLCIVGLPGARLRDGFQLPPKHGVHIVARGGPAYDSCAVVIRNDVLDIVAVVPDLGSNRRIWIRVMCEVGTQLYLCFFYLF